MEVFMGFLLGFCFLFGRKRFFLQIGFFLSPLKLHRKHLQITEKRTLRDTRFVFFWGGGLSGGDFVRLFVGLFCSGFPVCSDVFRFA